MVRALVLVLIRSNMGAIIKSMCVEARCRSPGMHAHEGGWQVT